MLTNEFCCRKSMAMACTGHEMTALGGGTVHGEGRGVYHSTDLCLECTAPSLSHLGKLFLFSVLRLSLNVKWK